MQSVQKDLDELEQEQQFSLGIDFHEFRTCIISTEAMFVGAKKFKAMRKEFIRLWVTDRNGDGGTHQTFGSTT